MRRISGPWPERYYAILAEKMGQQCDYLWAENKRLQDELEAVKSQRDELLAVAEMVVELDEQSYTVYMRSDLAAVTKAAREAIRKAKEE